MQLNDLALRTSTFPRVEKGKLGVGDYLIDLDSQLLILISGETSLDSIEEESGPSLDTHVKALFDAHVEPRRILCLPVRVFQFKIITRQQCREQAEGFKGGQRLAQAGARTGIERVPGPHADVAQRACLLVEEALGLVFEAVIAPYIGQPIVNPVCRSNIELFL